MKRALSQLFFAALIIAGSATGQQPLALIPQPDQIERTEGEFNLTQTTLLLAMDFPAFKDGVTFRDMMITWYDLPLKTAIKKMGPGPYITVDYDSTSTLPPGGYVLEVKPDGISIVANGLYPESGGVLNGLTTLLQLLEVEPGKGISIPCVTITDAPRFEWRGMHLDVSRHFFPPDRIREYIDYLALYKFNTFHWHLTDDQGWRIEIKQYPKLTKVGAWRDGSMVGHYRDQTFDTIRYGGYYTQKEIRDIVEYAADRHITIVPEIEMPGHAMAAIAAYPELACTDGPFEVGKAWGVYEDVYCPTDTTFTFLENVLDEVLSLFPSPVIHIGGDEVPKTRWKACSHCQKLMKKNKLQSEEELQAWFVGRMEGYINSKGRRIIGWDEILEGNALENGLSSTAMVMSWRGEEGGIVAAKAGHDVVMSPNNDCYFDHYQGDPENEPLAIGGMTTLEEVYAYEPVPGDLNIEERKYIKGAQANVWTEYIPNFEQIEYMIMPRMQALSEVLWTDPERKDYDDFLLRLDAHIPLLDKKYINYRRGW